MFYPKNGNRSKVDKNDLDTCVTFGLHKITHFSTNCRRRLRKIHCFCLTKINQFLSFYLSILSRSNFDHHLKPVIKKYFASKAFEGKVSLFLLSLTSYKATCPNKKLSTDNKSETQICRGS